jgi:valyl-tRNA synthetase
VAEDFATRELFLVTPDAKYHAISKTYDASSVEERLYSWWEGSGFFTPVVDRTKTPFTIIMPPPNVTGKLHLGHALTSTIEDALARYHRMLGEPTLWVPGSDHAGIATQMVVERHLSANGQSRHDLGREKFVDLVWEWVHRYGDIIDNQHRRLGASCDWTRKRFTLDEGPSRAVRRTFINLYRKGLIYQGKRIINWCPRCTTALSDLEVNYREIDGYLYYIRYMREDDRGSVIVATTRPETLLGDTAVAVNPIDSRYRELIGKSVILPVLHRRISVIADDTVEPEFGTGALKITPGHDPKDFEIGQRHGLEVINIMNQDGTLNAEAGPYQGYDLYDARQAIIGRLKNEGLLEKAEPNIHAVGHCQRCESIVEPIVSKQWFVRTQPLAKPAVDAVVSGRIRIVPERFTKVYLNWMENIRDWCISRQLWWGHRIPVWYCVECDAVTVEEEVPTKCSGCKSSDIHQDLDVLDTWFSSALWTHSTLGWPDQSADLSYFYPTSVMETGYDILFFWVARMIMMGLENANEVPFHTVFLHGLIRDKEGHKMSKTKGNVIDPIEAISKYGTDALRFSLTTGTAPGNDTRLSESRLEAGRNFANKLWNVSRFVAVSLEQGEHLSGWFREPPRENREDRWLISRLNRVTAAVLDQWNANQLGEVQQLIHDFIWNEFADWYIELAKVRLRSDDQSPLRVLAHVLDRTLRLLHPFMPFITEEIWQGLLKRLPRGEGLPESIMLAPYPQTDPSMIDPSSEAEMEMVMSVIRGIRGVRADFRLDPQQKLEARIEAPGEQTIFLQEREAIQQLARVKELRIEDGAADKSPQDTVTIMVGSVVVSLPLAGFTDLKEERQRLLVEMTEAEQHISRLEGRLSDEQFISRAPDNVVERERSRLEATRFRLDKLNELVQRLSE